MAANTNYLRVGGNSDSDTAAELGSRLFGTSFRSQLNSFTSSSPIAEASIARDLADEEAATGTAPPGLRRPSSSHTHGYSSDDESSDASESTIRPPPAHSIAARYHRPSYVAVPPGSMGRSALLPLSLPESGGWMSRREREMCTSEERALLRDNGLVPPKGPRERKSIADLASAGLRKVRSAEPGRARDEEEGPPVADERTGLLEGGRKRTPEGPLSSGVIDRKWEEAVTAGKIHTTWQREAKVLAGYSKSLILTFLLQYSLTVASIFTVGHIGKIELGAVSLASMTASITGYAVYQGLATSLDTLCPQAYGSGRKHLVGLQMQRMVYFLWVITIPIGIIWLCGTQILLLIVPERETARLAGLYLKVLLCGAPGYAAFESGKRFVQAQGMFSSTLYVLLLCAPLNAMLNYLLVWRCGLGFVGAPIAVAITENLLPLTLFLYVRFCSPTGMSCWGGFSRAACRNWGPMIRLALPGLVMVLAEFLAFEILTLSASWLSATHLAAQSILSTLSSITYQIPFPISIAASTRIANLIGATLAPAARTAARVALVAACLVGCLNVVLLSTLRHTLPTLFTNDPDVAAVVSDVLPLCAAFQLFDALAACCNGILRGLGRQAVGGWVNLGAYYLLAMPISFATAFGPWRWGLQGLWAGPALALGVVAALEGWVIGRTSWEGAVREAAGRNSLG